MIAGIFLCFVAIGIALGALFLGHGSMFLILAALPAAGLLLGLVSLAWSRTEFGDTEHATEI
jgi:hypothetical protein